MDINFGREGTKRLKEIADREGRPPAVIAERMFRLYEWYDANRKNHGADPYLVMVSSERVEQVKLPSNEPQDLCRFKGSDRDLTQYRKIK